MLPGELEEFIKDAPKMANDGVSQHKRGQQPVNPVNYIIMIHLVPHMLKSEITVLIIGVHLLGNRLVQVRIQETEDSAA